jgi:hypothetical protein
VNADTKPVSATPIGTAQEGTIASAELSLPKVDVPAATAANTVSASPTAGTSGKQVARANTGRKRLPQTASRVPMVAAFGTVMLLAGTIVMLAERDPRWFTRLRRR